MQQFIFYINMIFVVTVACQPYETRK